VFTYPSLGLLMDTYVRLTPGESLPSTYRCSLHVFAAYSRWVHIHNMFLSGTDFWRNLEKAYNSVPGSGGSNPLHAIPCVHGLTRTPGPLSLQCPNNNADSRTSAITSAFPLWKVGARQLVLGLARSRVTRGRLSDITSPTTATEPHKIN
jgi:hypothetical protein